MKRFVVLSFSLLLFATRNFPLFGQGAQGALIKNKARAIRDANNARQGIDSTQPAAPAAAPGSAAANAPRGIDPAQQANIDKLADDIASIKPGVRVPLDQRAQIQADTLVLAKSAKPSGQSLTNLVKDLSLALAGKSVALKETGPAQLARDINVVVNSMNLASSQVQPIIIAARNIMLTSGVPEDDYKPIVADLNTIVTDLQKQKPSPLRNCLLRTECFSFSVDHTRPFYSAQKRMVIRLISARVRNYAIDFQPACLTREI